MDSIFITLTRMLRGMLEEKTLLPEYDSKAVMHEARRQSISGIIAGYIAANDNKLPHAEKMGYISSVMQIETINRRMNIQVVWLASLLGDNNIRYAVMKGQTVARFYPNPLLRMPGDIDVYIAEKDFNRACRLIEQQGYSKIDFTMLHATYAKAGCAEVEIHFAVQKLQWPPYFHYLKKITRKMVDNANAEYIDIDGNKVAILPKELELLLYTVHAFNHVLNGGLGLRHITDWMLCVRCMNNYSNFDMKMFATYLKHTGMTRMFRVLVFICSRYLGLDTTMSFLSSNNLYYTDKEVAIGERLMRWISISGNFGHSLHLSPFRYYMLFLRNCIRFGCISRKEVYIYPFMKIKRWFLRENHL